MIKKTFFYLDLPYLLGKATYNENNLWTENDEKDLLKFLENCNERKIRFVLSNVIGHKVFENPNNKLIIKKEGLVVDGAIYPWNRLQPIKVSRNFGGMLEIKTREDEIIFSERATAVVKLPLFEAL